MSESEREGEEGGAASGAQGDEEREGGENEGGGGAGEEREEREGNADDGEREKRGEKESVHVETKKKCKQKNKKRGGATNAAATRHSVEAGASAQQPAGTEETGSNELDQVAA